MIGAGFMARGIALQIATAGPGMRLVAIANRRLEPALRAFAEAGQDAVPVENAGALDAAIVRGRPAATEDWRLLCAARGIDVILEVTGSIEYAAQAVSMAIANRKHVVLMNAELDATIRGNGDGVAAVQIVSRLVPEYAPDTEWAERLESDRA